jgi:hypothetical protein
MIGLISARRFDIEKQLNDEVLTDVIDVNDNELDPTGLIVGYSCW